MNENEDKPYGSPTLVDDTPDHSIAVDGDAASRVSRPCYTMSEIEARLGIEFGEKVQSNVRVRKWFRDREKELAEKYASSTCEFREGLIISLWLADKGIREFLVLASEVNFFAQPLIVRYVRKRRRKLHFSVEDEEYAVVLPKKGVPGKCYACAGSYHVTPYLTIDLSSHVFLCPYCAKEWMVKGRLRVK